MEEQNLSVAHRLLHEEFIKRRAQNPSYSLRAFSKRIRINSGALSQIMNGKRPLTVRTATKIIDCLKLDPQKANSILSETNRSFQFTMVDTDHFHVISEWYYFAILSLAETRGFNDSPEWIARRLAIPLFTASSALERLERIGMLKRSEKGKLVPSGQQFHSTDEVINLAARQGLNQSLELAKRSLEIDPLEVRDFTEMTMAISMDRIPEAKRRLRNFRNRLCQFLEGGEKQEVYKICLSLFPLSQVNAPVKNLAKKTMNAKKGKKI